MENLNEFQQIDFMYNACQLKMITDRHYQAVIPCYLFSDVFDYNRGFLYLEIKIHQSYVKNSDDYHIICVIRSIDDSGLTFHIQDQKIGKQIIAFEKIVNYFKSGLAQMYFGNTGEIQKSVMELGFYYEVW